MKIEIHKSPQDLGMVAGKCAAEIVRQTLVEKDSASIILATGTSQFETLKTLIADPGIEWERVVLFHLDEYIGLPGTSPASFRKYIRERFISQVPTLEQVNLINGEVNPEMECKRLGELISKHVIDVALVGIGENGHIAFNDPPADFETDDPFIIVKLDEACRKQQLGEGWFASFEEVPRTAISMSIRQIMKSKNIICSVPGKRKVEAIRNCFNGGVSNLYPASILQEHSHCTIYLDEESAGGMVDRW